MFYPVQSEQYLRTLTVTLAESSSERITVIFSADSLIVISFLSILIPLICLSFLFLLAEVSKAVIKRYAESGQPCLTPL